MTRIRGNENLWCCLTIFCNENITFPFSFNIVRKLFFTKKNGLPNDEFTIQIQNHNRNHLSNIRDTEFLVFDFLSKCNYVTKIKTKNLKSRKKTQFSLQESIVIKV